MMKETTEYGLTRRKRFVADFPACDSSDLAARFARQFYGEDMTVYESFFVILISGGGKVSGWAKISQGGTACTVVDAKMVAKFAIDALAQGVICVHNHPSGNRQPSIEDIRQTKKMAGARATKPGAAAGSPMALATGRARAAMSTLAQRPVKNRMRRAFCSSNVPHTVCSACNLLHHPNRIVYKSIQIGGDHASHTTAIGHFISPETIGRVTSGLQSSL